MIRTEINQKFLQLPKISWLRKDNLGNSEKVHFSYSEATQVLGYGAIGGSTSGLLQVTEISVEGYPRTLRLALV